MEPSAGTAQAAESATCTICGLKCDDRSAFNAHIRAHLKDKLTNRRKLQQQAAASAQSPRESVKRAKVIQPTVSQAPVKSVKDKPLTNIQSLLPSSPLPLANTTPTGSKDKPDLEALLSQLQQKPPQTNDPVVMAELAACKPIPPKETVKKQVETSKPTSLAMPCTPEISDMEEDMMSYEMEMRSIDFQNDLAFLLDQYEKDFESPFIGNDFRLDTPPDSDCETDSFGRLLNQIGAPPPLSSIQDSAGQDLLGFDRFSQRIEENSLLNSPQAMEETVKLIQSPASIAKVGKLPAETLAVLNKLPAKLFVPNQLSITAPASAPNLNQLTVSGEQRFVDVVKVESSGQPSANLGQLLSSAAGGTQCIINIECRNPNEPAKIIKTFRVIDSGSEIKLVQADLPENGIPENNPIIDKKPSMTSHCPICNKCITNKNMARHLEKHSESESDKKISCKICFKSFTQRSHLSRHLKTMHNGNSLNSSLTCRVCDKVCKNRVSLSRHKAKHLSCIHCSALFDTRTNLQDHLLKAHPEKAIVSLVQPPEVQDTRLDLDDLGSIGSAASHSVDYNFSPAPVETIGDSLADIADSNYFYCSDITDDFDIFSTATASAVAAAQ